VKIPAEFTAGTAQINVAHATLIGVSTKSQIFGRVLTLITGRPFPLPRGSQPDCRRCLMALRP
jgi:hypothetical protein